jgi:hypothetical protein
MPSNFKMNRLSHSSMVSGSTQMGLKQVIDTESIDAIMINEYTKSFAAAVKPIV